MMRKKQKTIEMQSSNRGIAHEMSSNRQHLMQHKFGDDESFLPDENSEFVPIYTSHFYVDNLHQPIRFLPTNQQQIHQDPSCWENCLVCCGGCLMGMAPVFAMCCCKCSCVYELDTSTAGLVESFGRFSRLLKPGFNLLNPCTEDVRTVDLRIQMLGVGRHVVITKDNVNLTIQASLAFRIINPVISYYVLGNQLNHALAELTVSSLRTIVGLYLLDEVLSERTKVVTQTKQEILKGLKPGILVQRVFMEEIIVPTEIVKDLSSVARERRIAEATIISTKGDVESAKLMKESADLLDTKAAMQIRYLQMVEELGKDGITLIMEVGAQKKGFKNQ